MSSSMRSPFVPPQGGDDRSEWANYKKMVMMEMGRLYDANVKLTERMQRLEAELAALKASGASSAEMAEVKAMAKLWGALAGAVPAIISVIVAIIALTR